MKHTLQLFAVLLLVLSMSSNVVQAQYDFTAVAPSGQTLYYKIKNNSLHQVYVTRPQNSGRIYNYISGNVVIPDTVVLGSITYTVTEIGHAAFMECSVSSITIPRTITKIENQAFYGYNIRTIYYDADSCSGLFSNLSCGHSITSLYIGPNVRYIDTTVWGGCGFPTPQDLATIIVDSNNTIYDSRMGCNAIIRSADNALIFGCKNTTIPSSVTKIAQNAFSYFGSGLTNIVIPNSVTWIGNRAFRGCYNLTGINIPNSVTHIGAYAFSECYKLDSIVIPSSVTAIQEGTFEMCYKGLRHVTIPSSVVSIGNYAFSTCSALNEIQIPSSVTSIGNQAFSLVNNIVYQGTAAGSPWGAKTVNGYWDGDLVYTDSTRHYMTGCKTTAKNVIIPNVTYSVGP